MTRPRAGKLAIVRIDEVNAVWEATDPVSREELRLGWENTGWTADGTITGPGIQYVLRLDPAWTYRQFLLFRDAPAPDLWLARDGSAWGEVNGVYRRDLAGCAAIVLREAPFTFGAVARRLELAGSGQQHVLVGVVNVETLAIEPTVCDVRRVGPTMWRIDGTTVELDENGLVGDWSPQFRRVS